MGSAGQTRPIGRTEGPPASGTKGTGSSSHTASCPHHQAHRPNQAQRHVPSAGGQVTCTPQPRRPNPGYGHTDVHAGKSSSTTHVDLSHPTFCHLVSGENRMAPTHEKSDLLKLNRRGWRGGCVQMAFSAKATEVISTADACRSSQTCPLHVRWWLSEGRLLLSLLGDPEVSRKAGSPHPLLTTTIF